MEQGWNPNKDEWDGDPDDWVDAKEFLYRGELMGRISQLNKSLSAIEKDRKGDKAALKALGEHNKKIAKIEYDRAIKALRKEKRIAMEDDDFDAVEEIEDKMDDLKESQSEYESTYTEDGDEDSGKNKDGVPAISDEDQATLQTWAAKNIWYTTNKAMHGAAEALASEYLTSNQGDIEGMLKHVDKAIRKEFPHKFKKSPTGHSVTQDSGRGRGKKQGNSRKYTAKDLSPEQASVAKTFVSDGVFKSTQEYVDQLVEVGDLPAQKGV